MRSGSLAAGFLPVWLAAVWATASLALGQAPLPGGNSPFGRFGRDGAAAGDVVALAAQFTAPAADRPAQLFITATVKPGWHIYSITQAPGGPVASRIKLKPSTAYRLLGDFQVSPPPYRKQEPLFGNLTVESHEGRVTWYAPIELSSGTDAAKLWIEGQLSAQPCDANTCLPPQQFPFVAQLGQGVALTGPPQGIGQPQGVAAPNVPPAAGPSAYRLPWQPFTTIAAFRALTGEGFDPGRAQQNLDPQRGGASLAALAWSMLLGFLGGIILNVMPCVLPVIGLKIFSFMEQSGQDRRKALMLNVWYSLGLLAVFLVLATLAVSPAALGWGQLFSYQGFSITLAAVVFVMGLSFLGVWEVPIPGFIGSGKPTDLAAREGAVGAFAKGVLTTVMATPCSAPLLAPALTWAMAQPPLQTYLVFLCVALGMASPYLLLGAFPALIRFLPRPGAWMETFKHVMGFVLLATVVFILTFLELPAVVPTIALLFGLWAACWWIGRLSPLADAATKARTWLEAAIFAGLVWIIAFPGIDEIVPGRFSFGGLADVMQHRYQRGVDEAVAGHMAAANLALGQMDPKTVLIDFTADWCLTCKTLEATVLNTPEVRQAVERNGVVTLHADWTHGQPEVTRMLELLGSKQVPVLAIFPARDPNRPIIFRGGYTQQMLLDALQKAGPSKGAA